MKLVLLAVVAALYIYGSESSIAEFDAENELPNFYDNMMNEFHKNPLNTNEVEANRYKVVCYFTNWALDRPDAGKYVPDNIDASLCTHIIYAFAALDSGTLTLKVSDPRVDLDFEFYEKVTALKKKGTKVLIAMGGWEDSTGEKYRRLLLNANARQNFITSAVAFIKKYNFDGLDIDLEYPGCWQDNCGIDSSEKDSFAQFVKELSKTFKPKGFLLSAAVSPIQRVIDVSYDVPKLAKYLDWISLMAYDYHSSSMGTTGHNAPLHPVNSDKFNAEYATSFWIENGAPSRKLVLGIPTYGHTFTLSDPRNHGLNAPSSGPGEAGTFTESAGSLSYYEICDKINKNGWKVVQDSVTQNGPYAFKGNQWVSYDDVAFVSRKVKFIKDMKLGGGMIWALDLDDFTGSCGNGKYPLLTALKKGLRKNGDVIAETSPNTFTFLSMISIKFS